MNSNIFVRHLLHKQFIRFISSSSSSSSTDGVNLYVNRTHTCGQLNTEHIGHNVTLCGWVQFQRLGRFITIRDAYGTTQLIINDKKLSKEIGNLTSESVIQVNGIVASRPEKDINEKMETGKIEIHVNQLKVLNHCRSDLPFIIRDYHHVSEKVRLENRYLDLRTPKLQYNLRLRSKVIMKMRQFLHDNCGFVEVETPTLFKRTPGGAQEFVVPTSFPNHFYSLTQSPQQLKQLLMIGSIDRYFQIARCYRDEGTKPDRQPEFTQLDIEMSFTSVNGIIDLIEQLLAHCWPMESDKKLKIPFPRMKYEDAFKDYGSDKPDVRYGMKTEMNSGLSEIVKELPIIKEQLKFMGKIHFAQVNDNLEWSLSENIAESSKSGINMALAVNPNDFIWICEGNMNDARRLMGRIRTECVRALREVGTNALINEILSFLWIVDFPLFSLKEDSLDTDTKQLNTDTEQFESNHHPFTAPKDINSLHKNVLTVISEHFDLILNGQEVGGGSMRIHDAKLQQYILKDILKEDIDSMQYFLKALQSGCPPHGGIALGLDRLLSIICNSHSIRDVIAFPKSAHGKDLMSGAPSLIPESLKQIYHIKSQ